MSISKIYSCTSNGALQVACIQDILSNSAPSIQRSSLPTRLHDWKLSSDGITFAYGGDEVDVSVWDTEAAFQVQAGDSTHSLTNSKKRKRNDNLFPGEVWRAKNVGFPLLSS
jgi:ribosome biogenesis protein NSA1